MSVFSVNPIKLPLVLLGLVAAFHPAAASAQLIEKCGELIGQSIQQSNTNLVVNNLGKFIFDTPGFGINRSKIRLSARWKANQPWVPCQLVGYGHEFDCPGLFRISSTTSRALDGDGGGPGPEASIEVISRNDVRVNSDFVSGSLVSCDVSGPPTPESRWTWKVPVSISWVSIFQISEPIIQYQLKFEFNGYTIPFREKAVF